MRGWLSLLFVLLVLAGCSAQTAAPPDLRPLAPLLTDAPRQLTQHIAVHYRGEQRDLIGASLIAPQQLQVSLLTPEGLSLMDIRYDGCAVSAQQSLAGRRGQIPPRALLADLQLIYWPLSVLQQSLPPRWQLREQRGHGARQRQLYLDGQLYTAVTYSAEDIWQAQIQLEQKVFGYRLNITNL